MFRAILITILLGTLAPPARAQTIIAPGQNEESQRERREAWLESMHRAPPGTDWRQIEAANRAQVRLELEGRLKTAAGYWTELGASGTTGRNHVVARGRYNPNVLYVGSALGGLWSGPVHGGSTWTPLSDALGMRVEHIVVVPRADHDDLLISDGDRLIRYSTNGGVTWNTPSGLPPNGPLDQTTGLQRLAQDNADPLRIMAMFKTQSWNGSFWEHYFSIARSYNGGASFLVIRTWPAQYGGDMWISQVSGSTIYLMIGEGLIKSEDFGYTWTFLGGGITDPGPTDDVRLAGSEAGAPKFYAAVHFSSGWRLYSSNGGVDWQSHGPMPDFWGSLGASVGDSAQVLYGGVQCHRSLDGGATFSIVNGWAEYYGNPAHKLHADIMGVQSLLVPPAGGGPDQDMLYISTDGGTYELPPGSATPTNLTQNGFRNSQYYSLRTSPWHPNVISAGSQDQGYQTTAAVPAFTQNISGDYGHLTGSTNTNDGVWSVYPGFLMLQTTESPVGLELPSSGSGFPNDTGIAWMPFILANPDDPAMVYFGARHLWRIKWTGPGLFTTLGSLGDFDAGSGDYVTALAIAPSDHQRWYVATNQGRLWYSSNAGASWNLSPSVGPGSHYFYGSGLLVSPTNSLRAYVCGSGYGNPGVYVTTNGGATWSAFGTSQPSTLFFDLAFDDPVNQTVYAATEAGPWRCQGGVWQNLLTLAPGAPLSTYWDIESLPDLGIIRFATYGRGIWDLNTGAGTPLGIEAAPAAMQLEVGMNPSTGPTRIEYSLVRAGHIRIELFDVDGRRVATLLEGERPAGAGSLWFHGKDAEGRALGSGIYLARAESEGERAVRKLILTR